MNSKENIVFFKINFLELFKMQSFMQKRKSLNLEPKIPYLDISAGAWEYYCHIWNQQHRICPIAKFCAKLKIIKFGAKKALLGCFERLFWNYCHIWNQHPGFCQKWVFNSYSEFWCTARFFLKLRGTFFLRFQVWLRLWFIYYAMLIDVNFLFSFPCK